MDVLTPVERTLTRHDHARLGRMLREPAHDEADCEALQELLDTSELVAAQAIGADVVTMGAQLLLEDVVRGGLPYRLTVCYPDEADPAHGLVSVLTPVGANLLGLRAGQVAHWRLPNGQEGAARILAVLSQPEQVAEPES